MVSPLKKQYKFFASTRKEAENVIQETKDKTSGVILKEAIEEKHKDDPDTGRWAYYVATIEVEYNKIKDLI